jgi:hypothetical protein
MKRFLDWFNNLYPFWLVALATVALIGYRHKRKRLRRGSRSTPR